LLAVVAFASRVLIPDRGLEKKEKKRKRRKTMLES
jgi:hypothetical protein